MSHTAATGAVGCRWSDELASFLVAFSQHLVRRRLVAQAQATFAGAPEVRLADEDVVPVARTLVALALSAMYHKSVSLRSAALETLTNFVYFVPHDVLPAILRRFWEAMEASNSVHQISSSIRCLAGVLWLQWFSKPPCIRGCCLGVCSVCRSRLAASQHSFVQAWCGPCCWWV